MTLRVVSLFGLFLVVVSLMALRDTVPFPGVSALPVCLGTALLLVAKDGWSGRLLSAPPLVFTGDLSYSLYLWHWPVLVFARMVCGDHIWVSVLCVAVAFGAAHLSRRFVELPFLEGRIRPVWTYAAAAMAGSILLSLVVFHLGGLPGRFDARQQAAFAAADDYNHDRNHCHLGKNKQMAYSQTCTYGDAAVQPSIAVWGDSHGTELSKALGDRVVPQHLAVRQITASACPPSVGFDIRYNRACRQHNADMLAHLKADNRIKTVILTANYLRYDDDDSGAMLAGMELSALELQNAGKSVVIVYPLPVYAFDPPSQAGLAMRLGRDPAEVGEARAAFDSENARVLTELDAFTPAHNIAAIRPSEVLCDAKACHVYDAKAGVLYFNGQHLNLAGAGLLAAKFTPTAAPLPPAG